MPIRHPHIPRNRTPFLITAVIGALVAAVLIGSHVAAGRSRTAARSEGGLVARLAVLPHVQTAGHLRVTRRGVTAIDKALAAASTAGISKVEVVAASGRVLYAVNHRKIGKPAGRLAGSGIVSVALPRRKGRIVVWTASPAESPLGVAAAVTIGGIVLIAGLAIALALALRAWRALGHQARMLRREKEHNEYLARHDALTGLPNRVLFRDRAHDAILAQPRRGGQVGLLLLDLDDFKEVNDTLGHFSGDQLLRAVSARLTDTAPAGSTLARLGGDEFALLLPTVTDCEEAANVAQAVRRALQRPFTLQGLILESEATIGIALCPEHAGDFEELMQRADTAMYAAKRNRTGYEIHSEAQAVSQSARLALATELHAAIRNSELVLHYQPKADLRSGRLVGAEALVRWLHPKRGIVPPDQFIPVAERSGLIRVLTLWVVEEALRQNRRWAEEGIRMPVSVNLSTRDLIDVQLPDEIANALIRTGAQASDLEVEITESVIMADPLRARAILTRLREMGVAAVIDDFGAGYSSLGYLKRLPVTGLKIDKSFVINMPTDHNDEVIVRSTVDLAHNLGLKVVAEGAENDQVWRRLAEIGCDSAQGFFLSPPLSASELTSWVRSRSQKSEAA